MPYAVKGGAVLCIDGVVGGDVEFRGFLVFYHKASLCFGVDSKIAGDGSEETLEVKVYLDVIEEDVPRAQRDIGVEIFVVVLGVSPVDIGLVEDVTESLSD